MISKNVLFALSIAISALIIACESGADSNSNDSTDSYNMALIQALDDEVQLIQKDKLELDASDAIFLLSWGNVKGNPQMPDEDIETGHAMAVAFSDDFSEKPYLHKGGLDMGDVILQTPDGPVELKTLNGRRAGFVYLSAPENPRRGHKNLQDFEPLSVRFSPEFDYSFQISGSDDFNAMDVTIKAPSEKLNLSSLMDNQEISLSEDLTIEWNGASEYSQIVIALLPLPGAHFDGERQRPSERPRRSSDHGPKRRGMQPDLIRLDLNDHPAIIQRAENNSGSFTIAQQDIVDLVEKTDAETLMLHVSAIDARIEINDDLTIHKIVRMNDRALLNIQ